MNEDSKPALQSTTVLAGLFTVAAALAPLALSRLGVTTPGDQQAVIDVVAQLAAAAGGAFAIYGRVRAQRRIG